MSEAITTKEIFRPSICHQLPDSHIHYMIILTKPPTQQTNLEILQCLSSKLGGSTAGGLIQAIQAKTAQGADLSYYGIRYLKVETIPIYEVCHKNETTSPNVDWDMPLFTPAPPSTQIPPKPPFVAKINH